MFLADSTLPKLKSRSRRRMLLILIREIRSSVLTWLSMSRSMLMSLLSPGISRRSLVIMRVSAPLRRVLSGTSLFSTTPLSRWINFSVNSIRPLPFLITNGWTRSAKASSHNMLRRVFAEFISMVSTSRCQTSPLSNLRWSSWRLKSLTASLLRDLRTSLLQNILSLNPPSTALHRMSTSLSKTRATSWTT